MGIANDPALRVSWREPGNWPATREACHGVVALQFVEGDERTILSQFVYWLWDKVISAELARGWLIVLCKTAGPPLLVLLETRVRFSRECVVVRRVAPLILARLFQDLALAVQARCLLHIVW